MTGQPSLLGLLGRCRWWLAATFAIAVMWGFRGHAAASTCGATVIWGRQDCYGYVNNQLRPDEGVPPFHNDFFVDHDNYGASFDKSSYTSTMQDRLLNGDTMDVYSAAVTIDIMLGKKGADFGGSQTAAINYAKANYNTWQNLIFKYDAAGRISWDYSFTPASQYENTGYTTADNEMNHAISNPSLIRTIRFSIPDGRFFYQQYGCGNPIGEADLLSSALPNGDLNPPTPALGSDPAGYNSGSTSSYSSCSTIAGHAKDPLKPSFGVPVTITYTANSVVIGTGTATAGTSSPNLYTSATPAAVQASPYPVTVAVTAKDASGATFSLANSPITIGPCLKPNPVCDSVTVSPISLDTSTQYTVTANVRYGSSAEATAVLARPDSKFFVTVSGPGINTNLVSVTPVSQTGPMLTVTTPQQPATGQTGTYVVGYGISGSYGAINCGAADAANASPPKFYVTKKPYFSVLEGDVVAGAGMDANGTDCLVGSDAKAGIVGWNSGSAGAYAGAGTADGAVARNLLQGFATGQGSGLAPDGAAFTNSAGNGTDPSSGIYGGNFDGVKCSADYFANASNVQAGNITLPGMVIANGTHNTLYVDGNVYITGNITFSGNYADASQIPSYALVVKGSIYIAPGVTRLDGFYIAQPSDGSATNGVIYDCAPAPFTAAILDYTLDSNCNAALAVRGSFVARQIWLLRTAGSVSGAPAETFEYAPEAWLSAPYGNNLSPPQLLQYDSMSGLSPTL